MNLEYLRTLPSDAGEKVALHLEAGEITLNQMLHEWASTTSGTSARSPSWYAPGGTCTVRDRWGPATS